MKVNISGFTHTVMKHKNDDQNSYNLSERLDHIAYMFNVRTSGKAYESFIVNAIYCKVEEPELMPFTQQYVHSPNDPRKYYLRDLSMNGTVLTNQRCFKC